MATPKNQSILEEPKKHNGRWRMIVCDLDGTLIGPDHKIFPQDRRAIQMARAAGLDVSICTGRSAHESLAVIEPLGLCGPAVFVTGATVSDVQTGRTLLRHSLASRLVADLIEFFGGFGHAVLLLVDEENSPGPRYVITSHGPVHAATAEWFLRNKLHCVVNENPDPRMLDHVVRLSIVADPPRSMEIAGMLRRQFDSRLTFLCLKAHLFDCHVIEVFHPNVDKWTGIQELCRMRRIDSNAVVTIGDDINDVAMLRNAALSFAMGNAIHSIQQSAKRVTRSQSDGGVAAAIDQVLAEL